MLNQETAKAARTDSGYILRAPRRMRVADAVAQYMRVPPVLFRGGKHENFNSNNQQSYWYSTCRLRVTRNGQEIFNQSTTDAQGVFSSVIDMPAGQGTLTLTFTVSSSGANNWTPTTSISDLLVVVMKKSTAGISIS